MTPRTIPKTSVQPLAGCGSRLPELSPLIKARTVPRFCFSKHWRGPFGFKDFHDSTSRFPMAPTRIPARSRWLRWPFDRHRPGQGALAGKINGKSGGHQLPIEQTPLSIITAKDADGWSDPPLHRPLAGLCRQGAVPDAQVTIGPVIENGFYYDFSYKRPSRPKTGRHRKAMAELAPRTSRWCAACCRATRPWYFKGMGEHYKAEIIASIPSNEDVSLYREGAFDLCRGPHVPSTGKLKHFKLMKVAGAYWRGDHRNEMLQRIYGTAWATRTSCSSTSPCWKKPKSATTASWAASWICSTSTNTRPAPCSGTPRAGRVWQEVEQYMRRVYRDNGYQEVKARRFWTRPCGRRPATGTSTARTCSPPSRKSATTRSSR
jgi:hypothetical protein